MALPVRDQLKYWGIAAAVLSVMLWILGDVLLPFILGGAIAYCLDPIADWLERIGLSRAAATAVITVCAMIVFIIMSLAIIPLLIQQAFALFEFAPKLFRDLEAFLLDRFPNLVDEDSVTRATLIDLGETIRERGAQLIEAALGSVGSLLNVVTLFLITPVVSVYLLMDWDRMVTRIDELVPLDHKPVIRKLATEVDRVLAGFIRGMGSVCLILGTYYAVALWAVGLQFGPVVGVIAGLLTFIPYVGAIVGGLLAVGLALFQFWGEWWWIVAVYAIFQAGQFVEGNVLTPNLVGNSVGLHPVWLLLALSVFGTLFGFVGLLVAVPLAAALGVIARFLIQQYKTSRLYLGLFVTDGSEEGDDT